jgi:hypothetical protein
MMIQIEMGSGFAQTILELKNTGPAVVDACSRGLGKAVVYTAAYIVQNYLSGQALKTRSHLLKENLQGWMEAPLDGVIGVHPNQGVDKYKWLLGDESKTIFPTKGKFLAIPIGEALTGAGVLKGAYSGGLRSITEGFFVSTKGRLLFGYKVGKKGKFRALFTLVKSVFIQGSGALLDGVLESQDEMTDILQEEIDKVV